MKVSYDLAYRAIQEKIAGPLNISVEKAADGIIQVVNANMIKGIRYVSIEKGYDPREFCLVAYGGCGPLHAVELAENLKISKVLIPPAPGVASAVGLLMADFRQDYSRTFIRTLNNINIDEINAIYQDMKYYGVNALIKDGASREEINVSMSVDIRYVGQGYELNVPVIYNNLKNEHIKKIKASFDGLHEERYGFKRDEEAEFVNIRISVFGKKAVSDFKKQIPRNKSLNKAFKGFREVFIGGSIMKTSIYNRDMLGFGCSIEGPAIIEQRDSCTVIFANQICRVDDYGNLLITL